MKKFLAIATPITAAAVLILLLLVPGNATVQYGLFFFSDYYVGNTGFWAFLFSPFPALLFCVIGSLVTLISSFTGGKSLFASLLWNGYFLLQLLIHLHDFYGASTTQSVSATAYYVYTAVFGAIYLFVVVLHILRARQNRANEQSETGGEKTSNAEIESSIDFEARQSENSAQNEMTDVSDASDRQAEKDFE